MPKNITKFFAQKYIAGTTPKEAIQCVQLLNRKGFSVTLDILGEYTKSQSEALEITSNYENLYELISNQNLDCNISIKPTHIGLLINYNFCFENFLRLAKAAKKTNNFLRIDMESSQYTDLTIKLLNDLKEHYPKHIGTVMQSYLHRTSDDLKKNNIDNIRICKGIYKESEKIAYQNRESINSNYLNLIKYCFENKIYVAIATHDIKLIKSIYNLITDNNISSNLFEFQALYGVPMNGMLENHIKHNYKTRIYVPFGDAWYDYSIRRLKENPSIIRYILKDLIR